MGEGPPREGPGGGGGGSKKSVDLRADIMPMETLVLPTPLWVPAITIVGMHLPTMLCC